MIVWGGQNAFGLLNDGAVYSPTTDSWTAIPTLNAPAARRDANAVWTGAELIVWGGEGSAGLLNDGMRLTFDGSGLPDAWQPMTQTGAPSTRKGHAAIWTGSKMIVWGGGHAGAPKADGAIYDPAGDAWTTLPVTGAPSARTEHAGLWNGSELLVWGGQDQNGDLANGAAFDPVSQAWRTLSVMGSPIARSEMGAAWSGSELILFGGKSAGAPVNSLQRLNPQGALYLFRKP